MSVAASYNDNDFDNSDVPPGERPKLVLGNNNYGTISETVCRIAETPSAPTIWYVLLAISSLALLNLGAMLGLLVLTGVGVWGNNSPAFWGWDIVNFVFWIGIGHAGTLISAVLYLFRQNWRTSINRAAEAMTIFAVAAAGLYPAFHVGRVWVAFYLFPYGPNQYLLWPNFRSPLIWDVFAVSTYLTISLVFWYLGMVPDLATFRDRAKNPWRKRIYGALSLGWRGSARQWSRYERAYLILAALSTPLVLSVHSVVSFDFATSQVPGWHTTIFPPYFVAGAIFSGFGMVLTLLVPAREIFGLKDMITTAHLDYISKIILATGCLVGYAYGMEFFIAWYSGSIYEKFTFVNRALGPYWWAYWAMITCNVITPQFFWSKYFRTNVYWLFILSIFVNIGMWFERFVIIVTSLTRDFLPSSWGYFVPTWVDIATFIGSFGLFLTLFLLFCKLLPVIA
ncbi:MAG TPA: NrfD/PsrC family molybdoenzyme membrane anchor subunit, partial [Pirellulales bacterium]